VAFRRAKRVLFCVTVFCRLTWVLGVKLDLKESTLLTWMATWRRAEAKVAKATAKKAAKAD
jgi:hypothetical protein